MASVSLCMIVKNEENVLSRCLNSVKKFADEIIIVDTGSKDNTKNIAHKFGAKVYDFKWCDDFSKARNFAFSLATKKYIMWLDADDVVPAKSLKKLLKLKKELIADTYMLKYEIAWSGEKCTFSYYRERILKNCQKAKWNGVVHECITPFGEVVKLNITVEHRKENKKVSFRNLKIYEKLKKERELNVREKYYYARELFDHKKYNKAAKVLKEYISKGEGWSEDLISAHVLLADCFLYLNQSIKHAETLLNTFLIDKPRANVCFKLGDYFLNKKNYEQATHWYKMAAACEDVSQKGGFCEGLYYNYYPYIRLCYVCYVLGDISQSIKYNNLAGRFFKGKEYEHNQKFFTSLNIGS